MPAAQSWRARGARGGGPARFPTLNEGGGLAWRRSGVARVLVPPRDGRAVVRKVVVPVPHAARRRRALLDLGARRVAAGGADLAARGHVAVAVAVVAREPHAARDAEHGRK